ncbi:MAG: tyrosine-type recombinase/integrase [Bacteroidota bacterium]|nr:tyrosine-type recombinase/integrase [Bacteroidota bacterium]
MNFSDFVTGPWKDACYSRYKPSTQQRVNSALDRQLLRTFGDLPLGDISPTMIHDWFNKYSQVAPGGANRTLDVLRQIFNHAIKCAYTANNPTRSIRRNPRVRLTRFLSREEIAKLHSALDDHKGTVSGQQQVDIIRLLLLTGCRKGELINLRWSEVDEDRLHLQDSKTGPRMVLLNQPAQGILAQQSKARGLSNYVFPNHSDPARPRSTELSVWRKVRRTAGLQQVRLHDLRHTFASHAVLAKVPLPIVSRLLGHRQQRITMRYAHVGDAEIEAASERIGRSLVKILDGQDDSA